MDKKAAGGVDTVGKEREQVGWGGKGGWRHQKESSCSTLAK